jgi:hypothetical protein
VVVGEVTDIGEVIEYATVTHTPVGSRAVRKFSSYNNGTMQIQMVRDSKRWSDGNEGSFDLDADYRSRLLCKILGEDSLRCVTTFKTSVGSVDQITGANCRVNGDIVVKSNSHY